MDKSVRLHEEDLPDTRHESGTDVPADPADGLASICPQPISETRERRPFRRKPVTTLTLTSRTCKWPFGDPAQPGFHYCGQPPQAGRPYCDEHDRMSYQATRRKSS